LGPCSTTGYTGVVFEPRDEYKGDLARNYFYMTTKYENRIAAWKLLDPYGDAVLDGRPFFCFEPWFETMLLVWHTADTVSQKEIDRNNTIYNTIQHNRNPFIDHPELCLFYLG
jgi:endonuclease I